MVAGMDITEIFYEDELKIVSQAMEIMRVKGFGKVVLYVRHAYVYRVGVDLDIYGENKGNKGSKDKNEQAN